MKDLGVVIFAYAPESPRNAILAYAPGQAPTTSARCDTCLRPRLAAAYAPVWPPSQGCWKIRRLQGYPRDCREIGGAIPSGVFLG